MKFFLSLFGIFFLFSLGGNMTYADREDFFDDAPAAVPNIWCAPGLVGCKTNQTVGTETYQKSSLVKTTWKVLAWMVTFTAAAAVLMLVVSGIMFLFGGSNEDLLEKAKKTAIYAIVGIFVAMFAYAIVQLVNTLPFPNALGS